MLSEKGLVALLLKAAKNTRIGVVKKKSVGDMLKYFNERNANLIELLEGLMADIEAAEQADTTIK